MILIETTMPPLAGQRLKLMEEEELLFHQTTKSPTTPTATTTPDKMSPITMSPVHDEQHQQQQQHRHHHHQQQQNNTRRRSLSTSSTRRVGFTTDEPTIYEIPNIKDELTRDELQQLFLTRHDLKRIKRENNHTLQLMSNGAILVDTTECCYRGLEGHMPIAKRDRYERVTNVLQAIFDEQDKRRRTRNISSLLYSSSFSEKSLSSSEEEVQDQANTEMLLSSHWIHTHYSSLTTRSQEIAIMMGLIDEDAARDYYENKNRDDDDSSDTTTAASSCHSSNDDAATKDIAVAA